MKKNYKYTYYEVIDSYPHILKSNIPIIELIRVFLYYSGLSCLYIYEFFKHIKNLKYFFAKKTSCSGREINPYSIYESHDTSFLFPNIEVIKTDSLFFSRLKSKIIFKKLIEDYPNFNYNLVSRNYTIRKREETISEDYVNENKTFIIITYPKLAMQVKNLIS